MRFKQWMEDLGHSRKPPYMPRTQNGLIGNELKTDAGATHRDAFPQHSPDFNTSRVQIPTMQHPAKSGLGDMGTKSLKSSSFKAGETPTISRGVPVSDLKGEFVG